MDRLYRTRREMDFLKEAGVEQDIINLSDQKFTLTVPKKK